jgi:glutamine cyclotransferase
MHRIASLAALAFTLTSCASAQGGRVPVYGYEVVHAYPHDHGAFTQGLIFLDGYLFEGTGVKGQSSIRKVELTTGRVVQDKPIAAQFFGEGLTDWGKQLIELTWQTKTGFVWDRDTFQLVKSFGYPGEGWGLTHDSKRLIMSDGSAFLRFWDPVTLKETGRLQVKEGAKPIDNLNELEFYKGDVLSNVWQTDRIARISLTTGQVVAWIDLTGILPAGERDGIDVLNGIAYDVKGDRLFVTGKWWPKLFEIKLVPKTR